MTIDERLDRLTERHKALTQTVELIARMHLDHEKRFEKRLAQYEKRQTKRQAEHDKRQAEYEKRQAEYEAKNAAAHARIAATQAKNAILQTKNEALMAQLLESIHGLTRIVAAHDRRMARLEERP